jgi:hypothetical protein
MRVLKSSSFSFLTVAAIGLSGSGFVAAQMMDEGPDPAQVRMQYLAEEIRLASGRVAHLCGTRSPHSDSWVCGPRVGGGLIPRNDAPYYLRGEPWFADPTSRALYNANPGSDYGMDRSGHGPVAGTPNGNGMVGSVSQSSTVHDLDMQISVEAEYKYDRPGSESHPHLRVITQADPSWWSLSDARDDTGSVHNPNAVRVDTPVVGVNTPVGVNTHGYPGFETSDRIRRTAQFRVDAFWMDPENEAQSWRSNTILMNHPHATVSREDKLSDNDWDHNIHMKRSLPGSRVLRVDLFSDIKQTKMQAQPIMIEGPYNTDDLRNDPDDNPNMDAHRDWSRSDLLRRPPPPPPLPQMHQRDEIDDAITLFNRELNVPTVPMHASHADDDEASSHGEYRNEDGDFKMDGTLHPGDREYIHISYGPPGTRVEWEGTPGTWRGVKGRFYCRQGANPGEACTISAQTQQEQGNVYYERVITGTFQFVPDGGEMVVVDDTDWLTVGVWEITPQSELMVHGDYEVGAFASGNDPFEENNVAAVMGRATYQGDAVGMYTQSLGGDTNKDRFAATATLIANFGDGADLGYVNGRVSDFRLGAAGTPKAKGTDWTINLETACLGGNCRSSFGNQFMYPPPVPTNSFKGNTSGFADGHAIDGRWSGRLYGNDHSSGQPGAIAGTFGAAMAEGSDAPGTGVAAGGYRVDILGAFGAYHQ